VRLRLITVIPSNACNFAAGLTRAPFVPYFAGTAVGILPSTLVNTYFAAAIAAGTLSKGEATEKIFLALGALCVLSLLPEIIRFVARRLRRPLPAELVDEDELG